jgi:hypothetical protein
MSETEKKSFNLVAEVAKLRAKPPHFPFIAFHVTKNKGTPEEYQDIYIKNLDASDGTFDHMQRLELDNAWPIVLVGNLQTAQKGDGVTTSSIGDEHVKILKHFENAETIRRQTRTQVEAENKESIDVLEAKLAKAKVAEASRADAAAKAKADIEAANKSRNPKSDEIK